MSSYFIRHFALIYSGLVVSTLPFHAGDRGPWTNKFSTFIFLLLIFLGSPNLTTQGVLAFKFPIALLTWTQDQHRYQRIRKFKTGNLRNHLGASIKAYLLLQGLSPKSTKIKTHVLKLYIKLELMSY